MTVGISVRRIHLLALIAFTGAIVSGCVSEPSFAVGDCVLLEQRGFGHDLDEADCATARGTFDSNERVYQFDEVLDGTDAICGAPQGFFPVQFTHEPDDVTYCLSQAAN
jgi:hypothetical protein